MQDFGVPLNFKDLSYLVLSSREEWEAAQNVAVYLNSCGRTKPIFSLAEERHTFDLGRNIAISSSDMLKIWKKEKRDALARIEGRWKEVLRKQGEVRV